MAILTDTIQEVGVEFDPARRVLEAQPSGTLRLRANDVECRALEDTGMVVAFALSHGPGM